MNLFPALPFFRITLPFVMGILCGVLLDWRWEHGLLISAPFVLLTFLIKQSNTFHKMMFMVFVDLSFYLFGLGLITITDLSRQPIYYGNLISESRSSQLLVLVDDLPVEKEKTRKLSLSVQAVYDSGIWKPAQGRLYAYLRKSENVFQIKAGDRLIIDAKLQVVQPPMNPLVFDYRNYLYRKQIYHTAFVDSSAWRPTDAGTPLNFLIGFGLKCKAEVLTRLKRSGLTAEAYGICAALLTGYDDDIDRNIMDAFSHSGTLHVLSVSGLHTGLIYLVLNYILNFFDKKNRYKLGRFVIVTIVLWLFALLTGFSAPVLRAVIMFNFLGLGKLYFRGTARNQLNVLLFSAFILLIYNPWLIADVGFLLSYFAMFGLIYFQPILSELWQPTNYFTRSLWLSISASFSATLSTLPITLFIFKQFPFWFFICNLVVVPATFVILIMAFLVVVGLSLLVPVINWLIHYLIAFIDLFNSPRWGFLDGIHFTMTDFLFMSLVIVLAAAALQSRSYRLSLATLFFILVWQTFSLVETYQAKDSSSLTIYHVKNKSVVSVKNTKTTKVTPTAKRDFEMHVKPQLTSYSYPRIDTTVFNYLQNQREAVLCVRNGELLPAEGQAVVTRLLLGNGRALTEAEIRSYTSLKTVIIDGTAGWKGSPETEELCRKFGIKFYDTAKEGAYVLAL